MKKINYLLLIFCSILLFSCQDEIDECNETNDINYSAKLPKEILHLKSEFDKKDVSIKALEVGYSIDWESPIMKEEHINCEKEIKLDSVVKKHLFPIELEAKPVLNSKIFESPTYYLLVQQMDEQIDYYIAKFNRLKNNSLVAEDLNQFSGSVAYYQLDGDLVTKDHMENGEIIERVATSIDSKFLRKENNIETMTSKKGDPVYRIACGGGGGGGAAVGFPMSASRLSVFPMNCGGGSGGSQGGWVEVTTYEYWDWFESVNTGNGWSDWTYTHSEWIATTEWQYVSGGSIDDHIGCVHTGMHVGGGGAAGPVVPPHDYTNGPTTTHEDMMICMVGGYPTWHCCSNIPGAHCNEEEEAMDELHQLGIDVSCITSDGNETASSILGYSNSNDIELIQDFASILCDVPDARFLRFKELNNLLEDDPDALLRDCFDDTDEYPLSFWSDLASFIPSDFVKGRLDTLNSGSGIGSWEVQHLENAQGKRVNLDYFPVRVTSLPDLDNDGEAESAQEFFEYWRVNINSFIDITASKFRPLNTYDSLLWNLEGHTSPLTNIMNINIPPDDGAVICSDYCLCSDSHWIFSTLRSPWHPGDEDQPGTHPVSGNRQFGYTMNSDGSYTFYTQGADRVSNWRVGLFNGPPLNTGFEAADDLWESLQDGIKTFVNQNGGNAEIIDSTKKRPKWNKVKEQLIQSQPINSISCE